MRSRPLVRELRGSADLEGGLKEGMQAPGGHSTPAPGPGLRAVVLCCSYARCYHGRKLGEGDVGFSVFLPSICMQIYKYLKMKS